jgi:hypothetical protein
MVHTTDGQQIWTIDAHHGDQIVNESMKEIGLIMRRAYVTHMRIPAGKVQPKDMDTVRQMFVTAERVGRPRK